MILQMEAVECGAASLSMILAYYGKWVPLEQVRMDCGVSRDGSNAKNILSAAKGYGLEASAYKVEPEELNDMTPCILHWDFKHFVVLRGIKNGKAYLNDPGIGAVKVPMDEFSRLFTGIAIEFEKTDKFVKGGRPASMWSYVGSQLKESKEALVLTLVIGLLAAFVSATYPLFTQIFTDYILSKEHPGWTNVVLGLMGGLALFALVQTFLKEKYGKRIAASLALRANSRYLNHVLRLPMEFFSQRSVGDLSQRQTLNEQITNTLVNTCAPLLVNLVMIVIYLFMMLLYSTPLALVGVGVAVLNILILVYSSEFRVNQNRSLQQNSGKYYGATLSCIDNMESIKAAGAENGFFTYWSGLYTHLFNVRQRINRQNAFLAFLPLLLDAVAAALVLVLGAKYILAGSLTIGMLLAFQGYMSSFMQPVNETITGSQKLIEMRSQMERIEDVMQYKEDKNIGRKATAPAVVGEDSADEVGKLKGELEMRHITFGYSPFAPPLIEDFDLHLAPGKTVAFVGSSGCGKSTLAKLISGLYRPWEGEILFDGVPMDQISKEVFTNSVAVIDQNVVLFDDTVAQNVKMWDTSIEDFTMLLACNDAQIRKEIMARPEGFDTLLVKGGGNFSGGQRQRIEIATALAREPSILIMDEATSALDPSTEEHLMKSIHDSGTTLVIIAHRLSTIRDADEIIVLHKGKVCQRGVHEDLMAQEGLYRRLMQNA